MGQKRAHIKNAIKELLTAHRISPSEPITVIHNSEEIRLGFDLKGAIAQLQAEHKDILETEYILALCIPSELRSSAEKRPPIPSMKSVSVLPGMNVAAIDYWFISELEKRLPAPGKASVIDEERTRIISKVFDAALEEAYGIDRVKTARKRIAGRRRVSTPLLPGQKP